MSNSFFMFFKRLILFLIAIVILICLIFIPSLYSSNFQNNASDENFSFLIDSSKYVWPTPGYTCINSYFGKRYSPTAGASSFHKGIDIGAPQGSNLIAITSGKISFTGFFGRWRIYYNFNKWFYENYLLSCFSTLHCKRRRYS